MSEINMRDHLKMVMEIEHSSLRSLAEKTGVSFATLSRFMRGADISLKSYYKIRAFIRGEQLPKENTQTKTFRLGGKTFIVTIKEAERGEV